MSYWFTDPLIKGLIPLATASAVKGAASTFMVPRIFMGANALGEATGVLPGGADVIARVCARKRGFIVTDEVAVRFAPRIAAAFHKRGFVTEVWDKSQPEPPIETVKECAEAMTKFEPDLIIALGGGSVMDTAKAAWILYERPDITDLASVSFLVQLGLRKKAFLAAIPTTSGTGSECTAISVVTDTAAKRKVPIVNGELLPDFAILIPSLTMGMPPKLTAGTGLDVLAHAMDCVMSPASNDFTDALGIRATQMVFQYLPKAYHNGTDMEARLRMHIAASMAGIAFFNGGVGLTHALGHSLGKAFAVHHGVAVGVFIPYSFQFYRPLTDKYLVLADALGVREKTDEKNFAGLIEKVRSLIKEVGVSTDLKGLGIPKDEFEKNMGKLVQYAVEDPSHFQSPRPMTPQQCEAIFRCAYEGKDVDF